MQTTILPLRNIVFVFSGTNNSDGWASPDGWGITTGQFNEHFLCGLRSHARVYPDCQALNFALQQLSLALWSPAAYALTEGQPSHSSLAAFPRWLGTQTCYHGRRTALTRCRAGLRPTGVPCL